MQKRITRSLSVNLGFTIVELVVVVFIIGILAAISIVTYNGVQARARDTSVLADIDTMDALQTNYSLKHNGVGKAYSSVNGYDSDLGFTPTAGNIIDVFIIEKDYCISGYNAGGTKNSITNAFTKETSSGICSQFITTALTLTLVAGTNGTVSAVSNPYNLGDTPTITATPNINYAFDSWTGDTGCSGTASHTITMDANKTCTANFAASGYTLTLVAGTGGTVSAGGVFAPGSTPTITASPSTYYSFDSWTGSTGCSGTASHTITMDANKTCTASFTPTPISAPATPTVTANTVGSTTTWSWGAASCPGNSARYQYRYTISPSGYDSGLVATAATSVAFTTSTEGQTYTVAVQAQCYNTATSSAWSASGSANYYRPVSIPTVVIGTQTWMQYNLDVGTMLTAPTAQTNNSVVEKWCYNNNPANCTTYGGLYQWNEMMQYVTTAGTQGIAPTGFHIPTDTEMGVLQAYLGGSAVAGDKTKSAGLCQGRTPCGTSGFNGLLGGDTNVSDGISYSIDDVGLTWTSSIVSTSAYYLQLNLGYASNMIQLTNRTASAFSVRAIKN